MIGRFKRSLVSNVVNVPGWRTNRKLVVILSDDWGSIRMASREAYDALKREGVDVEKSRYTRYDSLASNEDLERLFEVLTAFRDGKGRHPVITAMSLVANPDFERIRESGFQTYHHEPLPRTLERYPAHDRAFALWQEGMRERIFVPQFHGREHLHVMRWMRALQSGDRATRLAFDHGVFGITADDTYGSYMAAFDAGSEDEITAAFEIVREGLALFETLFDFRPRFFTAPGLLMPERLEAVLVEEGVPFVDVPRARQIPKGNGAYATRYHWLGQHLSSGQIALTRNCMFEPNARSPHHAVDRCLADIEAAFRWRKPAIISNHRVNFTGSLDTVNRDEGLGALRELLREITKRWPEAEFLTADELGDRIVANR